MITVEVKGMDTLNTSILTLISELNLPFQEVFPQEARLLAEEAMRRTPPFPNGDMGGSNAKDAQTAGEVVAGGDVDRAQTPVSVAFPEESKNKWLRKIIRKKDVDKLKKAFEHIPTMTGWTVQPFNKEVHKRLRGRTGTRYRVKGNRIMTLDNAKQKAYRKENNRDVGWMKAGWGVTVAMLQGRVPAWIKRNFGDAPGSMDMDVSDNNPKPYVRMWNHAPTIGRFADAYEYAVQWRIEKITEKVSQALARRAGKAFTYKGK
jgi:hypothetical protein